ncbi:YjgN family protein [Vandammella animalimorsus]|nr:YjgN family protein [Vandammella animalimorsus]
MSQDDVHSSGAAGMPDDADSRASDSSVDSPSSADSQQWELVAQSRLHEEPASAPLQPPDGAAPPLRPRAARPAAPRADKSKIPVKAYPLKFTGTGAQYFRVWFVNVLLLILTLGIYTPWARKRTAEYFFSHSVIARSPLEFHASIKRMVIGFFIFLGLYKLFDWAISHDNLLLVGLALTSAAVAIPFLWGSAKRFRVTATRWRGLRLRFGTNWKEIYWASWPVFLMAASWFFAYVGLDMIATFTSPSLLEETRPTTWLGLSPGSWVLIALALLVSWLCVVRVLFNYQRLLVQRSYLGIEGGVFRASYWDFVKIWLASTLIGLVGLAVMVGGVGYVLVQSGLVQAYQCAVQLQQQQTYEDLRDMERPEGVSEQEWQEFLQHMQRQAEQAQSSRAPASPQQGGQQPGSALPQACEQFDQERLEDWIPSMQQVLLAFLGGLIALLTGLQAALAYREAAQHRLVWNRTGISDIARFRCALSVPGFVWLRMQNWLLTLLTLGFYRPFARVREYRAKWNSTTVYIRGGVSQIKSLLVIQQEGGALADAVADFAGFDIIS